MKSTCISLFLLLVSSAFAVHAFSASSLLLRPQSTLRSAAQQRSASNNNNDNNESSDAVILSSSSNGNGNGNSNGRAASSPPPSNGSSSSSTSTKSSAAAEQQYGELELARMAFPLDMQLTRIEGGNTVRTWQIPQDVERAQVFLKTNGRPLKAKIELWVGPLRTVHTMDIDTEDGNESPYRALLKFKKAAPTLRVITSDEEALPVLAGVQILPPEKNALVGQYSDQLWNAAVKTRIQGGPSSGGNGAVRVFPIDSTVDSVQLMFWSKDTSKKSLKAKIEMLQGPNNYKQVYDLQCGGGSQPYHVVLETPGAGWVIRIYNKKFVEDGLFEVAIVPFSVDGGSDNALLLPPTDVITFPKDGTRTSGTSSMQNYPANRPKQWWE